MIDTLSDADLHAALTAPFTSADLEWKVQTCGKKRDGSIWALVVPYVSARAIQSRLDETVGPSRWRNRYEPIREEEKTSGFLCYLALFINGEWVEKCDGAELTDIEPVKGGLSNALKRCAVQWGIGRYLYSLATAYAHVHENGMERARLKEKDGGDWFRWDPPPIPVPVERPAPVNAAHDKHEQPADAQPATPAAPAVGDANELAAKTAHGLLTKCIGKVFADAVWRAASKGDWLDRIDLLTKANKSIATIREVLGGRGDELVTELIRQEKPAREIVADLERSALGEVSAGTAKP